MLPIHRNTLLVADMKDGTDRFVQSFRVAPDHSSLSVETTDQEGLAQVFEGPDARAAIEDLHRAMAPSDVAESLPFRSFRPIGIQRAWAATFKPNPKARKLRTIGAFFARTRETALRYAGDVVDRETFGDGVLISVEETTDPR